jgi:MFS family permease
MFRTVRDPRFLRIYVIPLISVMSGSMAWSISVLYALELGADILQVNLITTVQSTMGIVLLVPFGILSDRFGRKPMLVYSRLVIIVGNLLRAFATEATHLLLAAVVGGFAGGGFFPVLLAMIADVARPDEQQEAISTLYLFSGIGMLVGPVVATLLLTQPQVTLRHLYQIHTVVEVGTLLYVASQLVETKPRQASEARSGYGTYVVDLLRGPRFRGLLVSGFLFFFNNSIVNTFIPLYARVDLALSYAEVASLTTYRNLAILLIRFSSATFLTRVPAQRFFLASIALGGVASLAAPFAADYPALSLVRFLSGLSYGAVAILGSTFVAQLSTPANRGIANSLYNIAQSTGNITKLATTPVAEAYGLPALFVVGGVTAFAALAPQLAAARRGPHPRAQA